MQPIVKKSSERAGLVGPARGGHNGGKRWFMEGKPSGCPSTPVIVGIDEAGRGPLAGPVVAGACVDLPELRKQPLIKDSKQLTPGEREEAFAWITMHCTWGMGIASAEDIDAVGILEATQKAMQEALAEIAKNRTPTYILIDGRDHFWFDYSHSSIIKGDEKEPCISAASIIAKVTRDRWMVDSAAREFPHYGFAVHKGYGTPEHLAAIKKYGPCPLHRRTFLKKLTAFYHTSSSSPTTTERSPKGKTEPSALAPA